MVRFIYHRPEHRRAQPPPEAGPRPEQQSSPSLAIRVELSGDVTIVHAEGEIVLATVGILRAGLALLVDSVVVDLSEVSFLDSTGIAALVAARNRLVDAGGEFLLRDPQDFVRRTLERVGLDEWVEQ